MNGNWVHLCQAPEAAADILADMRQRAARRNQEMMACINAHLAPVTMITNGTCCSHAGRQRDRATHARAFVRAAEHTVSICQSSGRQLNFPRSSDIGDCQHGQVHNLIRAKLMKRAAWIYPTWPRVFPTLEEFIGSSSNAALCRVRRGWMALLPENRPSRNSRALDRQGAVALNIIPDRNWNIPDLRHVASRYRSFTRSFNWRAVGVAVERRD